MAESLCCAFDCSGLCFYSFSWSLCLHLIISSWNSCGFSKKKWLFFIETIYFLLLFSIDVWCFWDGFFISWLGKVSRLALPCFCRESSTSWRGNLLRCAFSTNKHNICYVGGLASTPSGLAESLACVTGSIFSLHLSQTSSWAEHCLPSVFTNLKAGHVLLSKTPPPHTYQDLPGTAQRTGTCLRLSEITAEQHTDVLGPPGRWMQWQVAALTALPPSASVLWATTDHWEPYRVFHFKGKQVPINQGRSVGLGEGSPAGSRKPFSQTLLWNWKGSHVLHIQTLGQMKRVVCSLRYRELTYICLCLPHKMSLRLTPCIVIINKPVSLHYYRLRSIVYFRVHYLCCVVLWALTNTWCRVSTLQYNTE